MDLPTRHGQELYNAAVFHFSGLRRNFDQAQSHIIEIGRDNISSVEDSAERSSTTQQVNDLLARMYITRDSFDDIVNQCLKQIMQSAWMSGDSSISFTSNELSDLRFVWDEKKRRYEVGTNADYKAAESIRVEQFFDTPDKSGNA